MKVSLVEGWVSYNPAVAHPGWASRLGSNFSSGGYCSGLFQRPGSRGRRQSMRLIMNTEAPEHSALLLNVDGPSEPAWRTMAADPKDGDGTDGTDGDATDGDGDGTDGTDGDGTDGKDADGTDGKDADGTDGKDADGTDGTAH